MFQEIDSQKTEIGVISLRKRSLLQLGGKEIYEIKLGDEYLMSSLFHHVEEQLAELSLASLGNVRADVVIGGLGLGYTAAATLKSSDVKSVAVVEFLQPVIDWHERELVPLGKTLSEDRRFKFIQGDFFKLAVSETGFDPGAPHSKYDAILLDIDHSPTKLLAQPNASFYSGPSLSKMAMHLKPGGVFGMWSDDPPDQPFMELLESVFVRCRAITVSFPNPIMGCESSSTVYVCHRR